MPALPIPPSPPAWSLPMAPVHIAGELYDVGSEGISAFVLKTKAGAVLIDAGMPAYAPQLLKNLSAVGVQPKDVKIIIAGHAHFDHAGGFAAVKAATGAKLAIMDADVHWDETGTYPGRDDHLLDYPPVKVDRVLHDGDTVSLGGTTLTAHKTPGHTPGCTTWTFPVSEGGRTYSVIYQCSMTVGANRLFEPQITHKGIVADYRKTFATLKTMKADIFLAPHAEQFDLTGKLAKVAPGAPNPFVDPDELQRRVATAEAGFEVELKKQEAAR